ncbi:hypothetical protein BJX70DRAFT_396474 [Aspergillus crustosus]
MDPFSPSTVTLKQELSYEFTVRFLITSRPRSKTALGVPQTEHNNYTCETTAYTRLQAHGLCDRRTIPKYHGSINNIDPTMYTPHLDKFIDDEYPPQDTRMDKIAGLKEIHAAGVEHSDAYPRNMKIFQNEPERVLWIEFDRAQTWDPDTVDEWEREGLRLRIGHCWI